MTRTKARGPAVDGAVPPPLLDLGSSVWRDPVLFSEFCRQQGVAEPMAGTWAQKFCAARDAWAIKHGYTRDQDRRADQARLLDELDLPWCGSLTRAMAKAEAECDDQEGFRAHTRLVPYGTLPDKFPRTDPRR